MKFTFYLIVLFTTISFFVKCEKDDICLIETQGTPRIVIRLYDKKNPLKLKAANNITIAGIGKENSLTIVNSDSIIIPLKADTNKTKFAFIKTIGDSIYADTLQFNYQRNDLYINRSCGYRTEFILNNTAVDFISGNLNWMDHFELLTNTVSNEDQAHLAIYH
tara:strand:+ start:792 stop:1280 length:489 start_codon:yes stop_codon:yes gene_type:complete